MWRLLKWSIATVASLAIIACIVVLYVGYASLPRTVGEFALDGVDGEVVIERDEFGIPTITASTLNDLYVAMGFVHAQDRLWQMEFSRRLGQGRLSEFLGKDALRADRFMRTLGLYRAAERNAAALPNEIVKHLQAYAAGINGFLSSRDGPLPPEFLILGVDPEPWRIADTIVMAKLLALDLSKNWRDEAQRFELAKALGSDMLHDLWPVADDDLADIGNDSGGYELPVPPANSGLGSNIWAVSGHASPSGQALLANDPHLRLQAPGTWYLLRLQTPELRAIGATVPALPVLVIGRNSDVAWGFTNSGADVQDLFLETIDPANAEHYQTPEGALPIELRQERIEIRGAESETLTVRATRHGPIISDWRAGETDDDMLALQWTAIMEDDQTMAAGFELLGVSDFEEFRQAIAKFDSPPQNAFYADRQGRIGSLLAGRIPLRRRGEGWLPNDGASGEFDWSGFIPEEDKPAHFDPPAGYLANANNAIVDAGYPHLLTRDWDPDNRIRRIRAVLSQLDHDRDTAMALQNDAYSILADDFIDLLVGFEGQHAAVSALLKWDRVMAVDRPEPLLFLAWYRAFVDAVLADELGDQLASYRGMRTEALLHIRSSAPQWCDDRRTPAVEDCTAMAWLAFERAMAEVSAQHGEDWRSWRWGTASRAHMAHQPFSRVPVLNRLFDIRVEKPGGPTSPNVSSHSAATPFATVAAASMRMIVDWSDPVAAYLITATGQSGHPLSRHYRDLTDLWARGEYLRLELPALQPERPSVHGEHDRLKLTPIASHIASGG